MDLSPEIYQLSPFIAIAGHVLQIVATFAYLLTPQYEANEDNEGPLEEEDIRNGKL